MKYFLILILITGLTSCRYNRFYSNNESSLKSKGILTSYSSIQNRFKQFKLNIKENRPDKFSCADYTIEGDALILTFIYSRETIRIKYDWRRDKYSQKGIIKKKTISKCPKSDTVYIEKYLPKYSEW